MKVLCAFISLFSCFSFLVSAEDVDCPSEGKLLGCTCSKILDRLKVTCKDIKKITDIPSWITNNTTQLEFENCKIRFLNQDSFKKLVNLTGIKIFKQNLLTFNDSLIFQGLNRLLGVDFDDTGIASLPAGLFANLPHLKTVVLDNNRIPNLPEDLLENSTNVKIFRVGNTQLDRGTIAKIGDGHFGENIERLFLSGTSIQQLQNNLFSGLPKLNVLALAGCRIESIGKDILKGTQVTSLLALDGNPITSIDLNAFRDSKVGVFECKGCQLTSNVTFNGFLKKMPLNRINLQNNKLTHVPKDAFTGLNDLTIIDLSNNSIATIEENPYASLSKCRDSTTCVQLHDNPLKCDCNLAWLRSFADQIKGKDKDLWKCAQPGNVAGKSLVSLKTDEFCCESANSTKSCGLPDPDPNNGWVASAHILVAILSQVVVIFGIPLLLA